MREDWPAVLPALPTMFVALVFHNIIPSITTSLEGSRDKVRSKYPSQLFSGQISCELIQLGTCDRTRFAP